jgi:hypothetical protein
MTPIVTRVITSRWFWKALLEIGAMEFLLVFLDVYDQAREDALRNLRNEQGHDVDPRGPGPWD